MEMTKIETINTFETMATTESVTQKLIPNNKTFYKFICCVLSVMIILSTVFVIIKINDGFNNLHYNNKNECINIAVNYVNTIYFKSGVFDESGIIGDCETKNIGITLLICLVLIPCTIFCLLLSCGFIFVSEIKMLPIGALFTMLSCILITVVIKLFERSYLLTDRCIEDGFTENINKMISTILLFDLPTITDNILVFTKICKLTSNCFLRCDELIKIYG